MRTIQRQFNSPIQLLFIRKIPSRLEFPYSTGLSAPCKTLSKYFSSLLSRLQAMEHAAKSVLQQIRAEVSQLILSMSTEYYCILFTIVSRKHLIYVRYGQFETNAVLDDEVRLISFHIDPTNSSVVYASIPHFWNSMSMLSFTSAQYSNFSIFDPSSY